MPSVSEAADAYLQQKPDISQAADTYLQQAVDLQRKKTSELPLYRPGVADEYMETVDPESHALRPIPEGESVLPKKRPDFVQKAEMISSGAMEGMLTFTGNLLSLAERGIRLGGEAKTVPRAQEFWAEQTEELRDEYEGPYAGIGKFAGEMLATGGPVGKGMGLAAQGAKAVGKALPTGLKTVGKYGTVGAGSTGVLGVMESQRYDPENPGQAFNVEAAEEAVTSPVPALFGAASLRLSNYLGATQKLQKAKEKVPSAMARDLKGEVTRDGKFKLSPTARLSQQFLDAPSALTHMGKRFNQIENIGDDVQNFIAKMSDKAASYKSKDLVDFAAKQTQGALKVMKLKGDLLWQKPFRTRQIKNPQAVKDAAINALDKLEGSGLKLEGAAKKQITNALKIKGKMTVEDAKNIQSMIGNASINARHTKGAGDIGRRLGNEIEENKNEVLEQIQASLSPDDLKDFTAARQYSANLFKTRALSPKIPKAIETEANARKLIRDLISDSEVTPKPEGLSLLNVPARKATAAAKVAKALEESDEAGRLNIGSFLNKTAYHTQAPEILGSQTYKSLQGLNHYLTAVKEAGGVGWWRQATMLAGVGAAGLGAGATAGIPAAAASLASYAAIVAISNHSPLKSLLGAVAKKSKLSDGTYNQIMKAIEKHLGRTGYLITEDGALQKKEEVEDE